MSQFLNDFSYATVWNSGHGNEVVLIAPDMVSLERAWNKMTNSRVPLKRDMVQRVRIEKRES